MANEFELPEDIIQHIQSYLDDTEAARSSALSKSWYGAWFTRPVLSVVQLDFNGSEKELATKTLRRYDVLNLKVYKFNLDAAYPDYVEELITTVLRLGVQELSASIYTSLPIQVFASTSLTKLSVRFADIPQLSYGIVQHSHLVSLTLDRCDVSDPVIREILLGFPLIEYLALHSCCGLKNVNVCNLTKLRVLSIQQPWLVRLPLSLHFKDTYIGSDTLVIEFCNLRVLKLQYVNVDNEFFSEFSRRFPCIEELVLDNCCGFEEIWISSHSVKTVKYICLDRVHNLKKVHLDVPNICKFGFSTLQIHMPSLSFSTASRVWVSHIDLQLDVCYYRQPKCVLKANWFLELREFLKELSHSTITLRIGHNVCGFTSVQEFPCFITAVVENVTVQMHISVPMSSHEVGDLFRIFRPEFITRNTNFFVSPQLVQDILAYKENNHSCSNSHVGNKKKCSNTLQSVVGACNLDEVTLELFEETMLRWQTVPLRKLINGPKAPYRENQARLRFKWRPTRTYSRKEQKGFTGSFPYSVFQWFIRWY